MILLYMKKKGLPLPMDNCPPEENRKILSPYIHNSQPIDVIEADL